MEQALNDLQKIIGSRSKSYVFWTGAGISAPAVPSWSGLVASLLKLAKDKANSISDSKNLKATIHAVEREKNLWLAFDRLTASPDGIGRESFQQAIRAEIGKSTTADIPETHSLLWALKPRGIVTLNLDLFTTRSASSYPVKGATPINIHPGQFGANVSVFKEERPFAAYPHGHLDSVETWTFTTSALQQRLREKGYLAWIQTLLSSQTVIFVGITADDLAVGGLLDKISEKQDISFKGHFWITHRNTSDTDQWAEARGIRLVNYAASGRDHSGLPTLLKELIRFRPPEEPEMEEPITSSRMVTSPAVAAISLPDEMDLRDTESLRLQLNSHAALIFGEQDKAKRNSQFEQFIRDYDAPIHNAYRASTLPGKNRFFGLTLLERANGGAFGNVYKAVKDDGEQIAVKLLTAQNFEKPDFYRNFRRGVNSLRILSSRNVPGIVRFADAYEIPPTLCMEWIEGRTLAEAVHQKTLTSWGGKISKLLSLANILKQSHSLPEVVLHRDLRPANVMLRDEFGDSESAEVVVLDFDLSWHKGAEDHSVMHSPAFGYLAPEQRRKVPNTSTRSALVDAYGFGMTAFFVCTGRDPIPDQHRQSNWAEMLEQELSRNACTAWISVPRRMARLIYGCTREEQALRLDMSQIQGELEALLAGISDPRTVGLASVVVEEIACRTEHFRGYKWANETSVAALSLSESLSFKVAADVPNQRIKLSIGWQNAGAQDWGQIHRLLDQGMPKLIDSLSASGWETRRSKMTRAFDVTGDILVTNALEDLNKLTVALDKALGHASNISGH